MKKIHDGIQSFANSFLPDMHTFASNFLPDLRHLPTSGVGKNILFFLGIFGFATMFFNGEVSASNSIATSIDNKVMTIEQLLVTNNGLPSGTPKVKLSKDGIQVYLGVPNGVLKSDVNNYVVQGQIIGTDIKDYEIDGTKIQNNAITSTKIVTGSITNAKIQDGTITCAKLNIPGFSCTGVPLPSSSCNPGQFLQGITSTGTVICATPTAGTGSLPTCGNGQILMYTGGTWTCTTNTQGGGGTGTSYWGINLFIDAIYNTNTGNVGIGLDNPSSKLTVSGDVKVLGNGVISTGGVTGGTVIDINTLATPDPSSILYVGGGKVGILTSSPTYTLDVVGTIRAGSVLTSSDARMKTNIKAIDNALAGLLGINGYSYTLSIDGSNQYGVLAQEVEKFFPYLVSTDNNGYKAVNYNGLIAPIIQAIHELDTKVQSLEEKYQSNENRINALESKLGK